MHQQINHQLSSFLTQQFINKAHQLKGITNFTISSSCLNFFQSPQFLQKLSQYYLYTGKGVNNLGNYFECLNVEDSAYYLGKISLNGQETGLYNGLCFTNECSSIDLLQFLNYLKLPFSYSQIYQPEKLQKDLGIGGYLIFTALFVILLTQVICTLLIHFKINKNNKRYKFYSIFDLKRSVTVLNQKRGQIKFFNGIRAIAFFMVLFGHQAFIKINTIKNILTIQIQIQKLYITLLFAFRFAVDVFFYIGGFFLGYLFLKIYHKKNTYKYFYQALINRYLRIVPLFLLVIWINIYIYPYIGNGPLYFGISYTLPCNNYWKDILFFSNYSSQICLPWTWYLQVDMQLFIIGLICLYFYISSKKKIYPIIFIISLFLVGVIYCFVGDYLSGYPALGNDDYQGNMYIKFHSRLAPYLIGLLLGIYLYQYQQQNSKQKFKLVQIIKKKYFRYIFTIVGLSIILFVIFIVRNLLRGAVWNQIFNSIYLSMGNVFYVLGLTMIIFPFLFGYSNIIKRILDNKFMQIVGKLSFTSYLIHYIIIQWRTLNYPINVYLDPLFTIICGFGDLVIILFLGFLLTITIEAPLGFVITQFLKKNKKEQIQQSSKEVVILIQEQQEDKN